MRLSLAPRGTGLSLILAVALLGCGNASFEEQASELPAMDSESHFVAHQTDPGNVDDALELPDADRNRLSRKIIYRAEIRLIVKNLDESVARLSEFVETNDGYVASSAIDGDRGQQRSSQWTVRVPVERFTPFREAVLNLGEIEQNSLSSEDVTGDFYDLRQRIENARRNEARLLEHLTENTKNLQEILTIEKELDRVRGEIERMQGRLKLMTDLSAMTTVTVSMREEEDYTPTAPPTFSTLVGDTFRASLETLLQLGQGVVLLAVGAAPWTPLLLLILLLLRHLYRRPRTESMDAMT